MTFPTESARLAAREAFCRVLEMVEGVPSVEHFDRLYPAQPDAPEKSDFYYEKDNWEYTWEESDFFDTLNDLDFDKRVLRVGRLAKLPDQRGQFNPGDRVRVTRVREGE